MSYENRQEDLEKIESMEIGDEYHFNMFQEGGCEVRKVSEDCWELWEITSYGISTMFYENYKLEELSDMIDEGYSWT